MGIDIISLKVKKFNNTLIKIKIILTKNNLPQESYPKNHMKLTNSSHFQNKINTKLNKDYLKFNPKGKKNLFKFKEKQRKSISFVKKETKEKLLFLISILRLSSHLY